MTTGGCSRCSLTSTAERTWITCIEVVPAAGGGAAEAGQANPTAVINQDAAKDGTAKGSRGAAWPVRAEPGDVLLGEDGPPQSQGVGVLGLGHGRLGVITNEADGLLEVPVRLGQPGPGTRADRTAPGRDKVTGGSHRSARYEHRLVEHRTGPYLPFRACAVAG